MFAKHKLVRELSLILLVKLILLYGIINFIVPSATVINDSDVGARLLNTRMLPQPSETATVNQRDAVSQSAPASSNPSMATTSDVDITSPRETP
ncbi:hypothetical protein [Oceanospirillum maris]|jgi:hypothetical protein|uniref:hypothetical protein n=1 Tax=Oceanospirillum maris TaxID=64977 RepID=UPI00041B8C7D|nr:hypothetical protein [Oceanospirillum maris]